MRSRLSKTKVKTHNKKWWYNKLDVAMSLLVREKGKCERCGSVINMLNHAHVIGRANKALRYDIFNAMCLCVACHMWWHENPTESGIWFKEKYPERYEYLNREKNRFVDRTEQDFVELMANIQNKNLNSLIYT